MANKLNVATHFAMQLSDGQLATRGWGYVSRRPDGDAVSVCANGFPNDAGEWMREQIEAGNTVRKLPAPTTEGNYHGDN